MVLAESGDSEVLSSSPQGEEQRVLLFQEYANGGLSLIKEFFKDRTIDLDGVLSFIETHQARMTELEAPDLDLTI
jgi:dnd system-associated protein 4